MSEGPRRASGTDEECALSSERGAALRRGGSTFTWRKSSYSTEAGTCCEVAFTEARILVRDSKLPSSGVLSFTPQAWQAMVRYAGSRKESGPVGK
ncbi:DUF397 domain-containing protein [Streptomyces sp. NPDC005303]|uniref:DUF397 domain-containing protein n=1 Tax=Streptomyces sp. NPDC005303 TaxID=3155713 RepID=UPI0033B0D1F2